MGLFERYLSVWVGLAITAGVIAGSLAPNFFAIIAGLEIAQVNIVIAALIWLMIYPMMVQIDFSSIKDVGKSGTDHVFDYIGVGLRGLPGRVLRPRAISISF
jgi:ACR3 family arsenite transporter